MIWVDARGLGDQAGPGHRMELMPPGSYVSLLYAFYILREAVLRLFGRWARPKYPALFVGPYLSRIKGRVEREGVRSAAA